MPPGLSAQEARDRLARHGPNEIQASERRSWWATLRGIGKGAVTLRAASGDKSSAVTIIVGEPAASLAISPSTLTLDAIAKTFRYLDPDEAAAQREAALKDKKAKKAKKGGAK